MRFDPSKALLLLGSLSAVAACSPDEAGPAAVEQVRQEIVELKEGQQAIRDELAEIRQLLQARPAPSRATAVTIAGPVDVIGLPVKGDRTASVVVIELTDYECPFCKRHAQNTLPQIESEYVATGKVRYAIMDLPLGMHPHAPKAAEAAHCAGEQDRYWQMHDTLFDNQNALGGEQLMGYARSIGLDADAFSACLQNGTFADRVAAGAAEANRLGITGTPTTLIGRSDGDTVTDIRVVRGAQPYGAFKSEIDKLLGDMPAPTR
jgi:protein-disulfide isomerase